MNTLAAIEVMQAYLSGKKIEGRLLVSNADWANAPNPHWDWRCYEYRVKPETKKYRVCLVPSYIQSQPRPYAVPEAEWKFMEGKHPWISDVLEYEPQSVAKG